MATASRRERGPMRAISCSPMLPSRRTRVTERHAQPRICSARTKGCRGMPIGQDAGTSRDDPMSPSRGGRCLLLEVLRAMTQSLATLPPRRRRMTISPVRAAFVGAGLTWSAPGWCTRRIPSAGTTAYANAASRSRSCGQHAGNWPTPRGPRLARQGVVWSSWGSSATPRPAPWAARRSAAKRRCAPPRVPTCRRVSRRQRHRPSHLPAPPFVSRHRRPGPGAPPRRPAGPGGPIGRRRSPPP